MRNYEISFRLLAAPDNTNNLITVVAQAFQISYNRSRALCHTALRRTDVKVVVTAEQLGDLQAARISLGLCDEIRYLCDCIEVPSVEPVHRIELRPGLRTIPVE